MLLPRLLPLFFLDNADAELRDVTDVSHQSDGGVDAGVASLQAIVVRDVGGDRHPLWDRRALPFVGIVSRRQLNCDATLPVLGEDLREWLHELGGRVDAQLDPEGIAHWLAKVSFITTPRAPLARP